MGLLPLTRMMATGRPGGTPLAARAGVLLDWAAFAGHVGALHRILAEEGAAQGAYADRWAVFAEDAYAFAVSLMAIWQAGGVPVVLPNSQPGTLSDAAASIRAFITDADITPSGVRAIRALQSPLVAAWRPAMLDRSASGVELFTSGTTGDRKTVVKTFAQLEDEISGLERSWGAVLEGCQAIGTVSHQHIYGLLFRVLWPLSAGRIFRAEALFYPEEMLARLGPSPGYLVSTPAHLRRLADMRGASALARVCRPFFSSGAPLGEATAARLVETVGFAPLEVFGSTETGGVAWREQTGDAGSVAWTPFDDVRVRIETSGLLHVLSPRVSAPGTFTMADRVGMLADGRFVLKGRSDRVVKVVGKRLSLPEMEERLLRHPSVGEAALTVVGPVGESRVVAAIVLTAKGRARLIDAGRRALSTELTAHLAPYWDRVLLPRVYRYVSRLPEDAQGKVDSAALAGLFEASADGTPWSPEILEEKGDGMTCTRRLRVPDAAAFEGHFPEMAVVPGFVQIDWVMDVAAHLTGHPMTLARLEALKFKDLLRPDEVVELRAELSEDSATLTFRLVRAGGRVVSQGRCWLVEETA